SAGALNGRFILHAVTFDHESDLIPTERTFRQLARTTLVRCEALGIRRLTVFGSQVGAPSLDPSHVAQLFGFALKEHLVSPSGIREITLLLPDQRALAAYLSARIGDSDSPTVLLHRPEQNLNATLRLHLGRTSGGDLDGADLQDAGSDPASLPDRGRGH